MEQEHGLEQDRRRHEGQNQAASVDPEGFPGKLRSFGSHGTVKESERRELEEQKARIRKTQETSFPSPPTTRAPAKGIKELARPFTQRQPGLDESYER